MNVQGTEDSSCEKEHVGELEDEQMDPWQLYFSKLFPKLLTRIGKIRNNTVQVEFFKKSCTSAAEGTESAGNAPAKDGQGY